MVEKFTYRLPSLFTFLGRHYLGIRNIINLYQKKKGISVLDVGCGPLEPFYFAEMLSNSKIYAVDLYKKNVDLIKVIDKKGVFLPDLAKLSCNYENNGKILENEEFKKFLEQNILDYEKNSGRKIDSNWFTPSIKNNNIIPQQKDITEVDFSGYDIIYLGSILQNLKKTWNLKMYLSLLRRIKESRSPNTIVAGSTFYTEIYSPGNFLGELLNAGFDFPVLILEDLCTRMRGGKKRLIADYTWAIPPERKRRFKFNIPRDVKLIEKSMPAKNFPRSLSLTPNILLYAKKQGINIILGETPLKLDYRRKFFDIELKL